MEDKTGVSAGLTKGKKGAKKLQLKTLSLQPRAAEFDKSRRDETVQSCVECGQFGQPTFATLEFILSE